MESELKYLFVVYTKYSESSL